MANDLLRKNLPIYFSLPAAVLTVTAGTLIFIGNLLGNNALIGFTLAAPPMSTNSAFCFALIGLSHALVISLILSGQPPTATRRTRLMIVALSSLPLLIGLLTLTEYLSGQNLGIDDLALRIAGQAPPTPGLFACRSNPPPVSS